MDMVMLLLLTLLFSGNGNNNDNRDNDRDRERERGRDRDRFRDRDRDRFFNDENFTTPFRSAQRSLCSLETLTFILLFFFVNEINAPIAAVPVPVNGAANPFFERFERFEGEEEFEFE